MKWEIKWNKEALEEYKSHKIKDNINKINKLLESIEVSYSEGIGAPERLKGYKERIVYSRRINKKDRLIYEVILITKNIVILAIKGHYNDK